MILDVKKRHQEFFDDESRHRLSESARAVKLTHKTLATASWPIGAIDRGADDRAFFESYVFGGEAGVASASEIESLVASLPGLDDRDGYAVARKLLP